VYLWRWALQQLFVAVALVLVAAAVVVALLCLTSRCLEKGTEREQKPAIWK
jgi:hypothetical protein